MTTREVLAQLDSLIGNSRDFHSEDGDIWEKDIEALEIAKKAVKSRYRSIRR